MGSCAQIGKDVHLSGGVGIGGVRATPSITSNYRGWNTGSRCIVVEGVRVGTGCTWCNAGTTSSNHIIDVTGPEPVEHKGMVPARSVVIPGSRPKDFPSGTYKFLVP